MHKENMFFSLHQAINNIKFQEEEKIATARDKESMKSLIGKHCRQSQKGRKCQQKLQNTGLDVVGSIEVVLLFFCLIVYAAYDSRNNRVALVQQRSPVVKNLGDFAVATGMKHVVVLSGLEFMTLQKIDASRYMTYLAPILMEQMILGNDLGGKNVLEYNPAQRTRISTLAEGNSM
ncbi:hypothetical protein POTOM_034694 [Populus tomentosa]|uniref:Uncharacterized protein n=1 Tax=Populus tomentosa TaxID=118781 RepID=A0A8X7Z594_POPTO|nr:hypothetical protein POTOM_034694 [Populus tomentosa]